MGGNYFSPHQLSSSPLTLINFRRYPLPAAKTMPMPEPKYLEQDDDTDGAEEGKPGMIGGKTGLAAWMPLMCEAAAEDIVRSAVTNVSEVQWCNVQRAKQRHQRVASFTFDIYDAENPTARTRVKVMQSRAFSLAPGRNPTSRATSSREAKLTEFFESSTKWFVFYSGKYGTAVRFPRTIQIYRGSRRSLCFVARSR